MDTIAKLTKLMSSLPGIGPRQAQRIVHALLRANKSTALELADSLSHLHDDVVICESCKRFFIPHNTGAKECGICTNPNRSSDTLMVVEKDVDFENIEKSGVYNGLYFILGGTLSPISDSPDTARVAELDRRIAQLDGDLQEVILALSATPAGEETTVYLEEKFAKRLTDKNIKLSRFGRGLSTGSELEYSDAETIKSAFESRV